MQREEFEQWLDDHVPEAMDRIEVHVMPLKEWLRQLGQALRVLMDDFDEDEDQE